MCNTAFPIGVSVERLFNVESFALTLEENHVYGDIVEHQISFKN